MTMPTIPQQPQTLIQTKNVAMTRVLSPSTDPAAVDMLATIQSVLQGQGITDLADLGTLPISGAVKPAAGTFVRAPFVKAAPGRTLGAVNFTTVAVQVVNARRIVATATNVVESTPIAPAARLAVSTPVTPESLPPQTAPAATPALNSEKFSGTAVKMIGQPLASSQRFLKASVTARTASVTIPLNTAYWAAGTITFAPGTQIVIDKDVRYLVIIASSITGAANVTLTYEDIPVENAPGIPGTPQTPIAQPPVPSTFNTGTIGYPGAPGTSPLQISTPPDAPQVQLWALSIDGLPTVLLKGQQGYTGVQGGNGQQGGQGGNGTDSVVDYLGFCTQSIGAGGQGGPGGRGGDGGPGGNGGTGGCFSLYTATAISGFPFVIDVSGGDGGVGGSGGNGGPGGAGGKRGNLLSVCNSYGRTDGGPGIPGGPGDSGGQTGSKVPSGAPGAFGTEQFVTITANDFLMKLTDPAITSITTVNPIVNVGTTITINGLRFTPTDQVTVGGVAAAPTFVSDTMLQCVVPNTAGGVSKVQVTRSGGSQGSNYGNLFITPTLISTVPANLARLTPGKWVQILGTGFSPQTTVWVQGVQITQPSSTDTQFINTQNIKFMMRRPNNVPRLPSSGSGEPALLSVASGGPILQSNAISILVTTYQMVVIGDSVAWGEGLQEPDKWSTKVGAHVTAANAGMSVYTTRTAHTGAILGWNAALGGTVFDGDIPESDPSVHQQALDLAALPNAPTVDLILVTATANDVGSNSWLDPAKTPSDILPRVTQYCHDEMLAFLGWLGGAFPAAKIIVTGYYPMLSTDSDPNLGVDVVAVYIGLDDNQGLLPSARAVALGLNSATQTIVANNTMYFATQANAAISRAVNDANRLLKPTRVHYADPGFGPRHAAYTGASAWVFGVNVTPLGLEPTDSAASAKRRALHCQILTNSLDQIYCDVASTGHPNEWGAAAYAAAVIALL